MVVECNKEDECVDSVSRNWERERVFSLEVTLERVCWLCKWKCKKRKSVYRKYVSWSRLQKRGTKLKCRRSFEHWPHGSPGQWVPETECLRVSAIFVSGTSDITSILNYRSVSPINTSDWVIKTKKAPCRQGLCLYRGVKPPSPQVWH